VTAELIQRLGKKRELWGKGGLVDTEQNGMIFKFMNGWEGDLSGGRCRIWIDWLGRGK